MTTPPMTMAIVVTFMVTTPIGVVVILAIVRHACTLCLRLYPPHSCIPFEPPILNLPTASDDCNGCYIFEMNKVWGCPPIGHDSQNRAQHSWQ